MTSSGPIFNKKKTIFLKKLIPPLFLGLFFFFFICLNILVGSFLVDFYNPLAVASLVIIELLNIIIAYRLSEFLISLFIDFTQIPKLDQMKTYPKVAILYLTYNDAMPGILELIKHQKYPDYDIFILDDSTDQNFKDIVDNSGYKVIRRAHRNGFKAGAINNWLSIYGDNYPYFVILDSDSIINDNFTERMLEYAEHPDNVQIAVFQSKWRIWNTKNKFPRIVGALYPLWFYSFEKLANAYSTPLIMGHNNLLRTRQIIDVEGFDEEYVCEDLAISLKLIEHNYEVKYVDMVSYESCPENARDYAKRNIRWGNGTIEVARKGTRNISFIGNFHLFMTTFSYLIYIFYLPGMFIVTWGYYSTFEDAAILLDLLFSGKIFFMPIVIPLTLIFLYIFFFYFMRLPLALKLKIPLKDYFLGLLVIPAIDFYMLIPLISGLLKTIAGKKVHFTVTSKDKTDPTLLLSFKNMGMMNIVWIVLILGVIQNPVSFIFNFFWLIPYIFSPFIVYLIEKN